LWKDASKAEEAANALKITAQDLLRFGIADEVIQEPQGGAQKDATFMASAIKAAFERHLNELKTMSGEEIKEDRFQKFMKIGQYE
jgi:acetyl-CoA carboxylase carboxyl transferase subunit alpha